MKHMITAVLCLMLGTGLLAGYSASRTAVQATPEQATAEQATPEQATPEQATPEQATPTPAPQAESIELEKTEGILTTGSGWTLRATVLPEDAADKTLTWTSDNEAVATVDENGVVTAHSAGVAVLTARCGNATAQYTMYVRDPAKTASGRSSGAGQSVGQAAGQQPVQAAQPAAEQAAEQPAADEDPLVTNRWGITLHQSEWDEIYRQSGARPDDCTGYSSGIDWTKDPSCAESGGPGRDLNGNIVHGGYDASAATPPADSTGEAPAGDADTGDVPAGDSGADPAPAGEGSADTAPSDGGSDAAQPESETTIDG